VKANLQRCDQLSEYSASARYFERYVQRGKFGVRGAEKCLSLIFAHAALVATLVSASADNGAHSAKCKEITARLVESTGTAVDHYSPSADNVFFTKPDMHLSCMGSLIGVSLNWDINGFPPNAWFELLAIAGKAVTDVDVQLLMAASRSCHRDALRASSKLADVEISRAKIECQAFTRDGGGVDISIWLVPRR
jgi:hypothetical protein